MITIENINIIITVNFVVIIIFLQYHYDQHSTFTLKDWEVRRCTVAGEIMYMFIIAIIIIFIIIFFIIIIIIINIQRSP